jgi:hypothetical protein
MVIKGCSIDPRSRSDAADRPATVSITFENLVGGRNQSASRQPSKFIAH